MAYLGREYIYVKQEHVAAFLKGSGVPEEQIAKLANFNPSTKLVKDGDTYTNILITPKGNRETKFKSGVEFDDVVHEKIPVKSTFVVDGNKIIQTIIGQGNKSVIIREYDGDEMIMTITGTTFDGSAKILYKAV